MGGTPRQTRRPTRVIRAVLDTTAVALYAHGGNPAIPIGELIGEIVDENAHFGVPALCLAAAVSELGAKSGLLDVLASHTACTVLPASEDWRAHGLAAATCGSLDSGAAYLEAVRHGAYIVTAHPDAYGGRDADGIIAVD